MIVTNVFKSDPAMGVETIRKAIQESRNVVAIKDDILGNFGVDLCKAVKGTDAIVSAGGRMKNHLLLWQNGCGQTYLSTFQAFAPNIEKQYWATIQIKDTIGAQTIIDRYETPLFDYLFTLPCGWNAGMHAILSVHGITKRWLPNPYLSASDETIEQLKGFLQQNGML